MDYFHLALGVINATTADIKFIANTDPARHGCYTFDVTLGRVVNQTSTFHPHFKTKVTEAGDIIDITLDLENKKVDCKVNEKDVEKSIEKIEDGEYRLLASLFYEETELELL